MSGILLDETNDLQIAVRRAGGLITDGLCRGESNIQDAFLVLKLNQGELKEDPVAGTNLVRNIRSKASKLKIRDGIRKGFLRAGIDFEEMQNEITILLNKQTIEL